MLSVHRTHDFQLFLAPANDQTSGINPPSFNWPGPRPHQLFRLELVRLDEAQTWQWEGVCSPFQINFTLPIGDYRWRVSDDQCSSQWFNFSIDANSQDYLPPTARELFELCDESDQFLLYFDQDLDTVRSAAQKHYARFKETVKDVDIEAITYPAHYRRGKEEGKRTAIANVRRWIDRDLMALTLLYKIWDDEECGQQAIKLLLRLAEWSPEGAASLLRPCTWGDEVGCSLARNLFLAYHWLSPLLVESEKQFIRPMLIRIAYQMEQRLEEDQFKQYPGHSHTSRLPSYLGLAALTLHKEFKRDECERWLDYALMIYRGVFPFYGGDDGSWAEGPFYASTYTKWHHPFFLAVERLSGFSFYNHPFYKNFCQFAMDFIATDDAIHPFGDGFWCQREGQEWPGFFSQNPLRIYADRFGDDAARAMSDKLENSVDRFKLHLLDVVATVPQLAYAQRLANQGEAQKSNSEMYHKFYAFAGFGRAQYEQLSLLYRASLFGNSSHRHGDQGGFALMDNGLNVLTPTGSYGYRFASGHHSQWTRTSLAHNVPLIHGQGQLLDDESASAVVLRQAQGDAYALVQIDLSPCYSSAVHYHRTLILLAGVGVVVHDDIHLKESLPLQWRLHSALAMKEQAGDVILGDNQYQLSLLSHADKATELSSGYEQDTSHQEPVISDASDESYHLQWQLSPQEQHRVLAACWAPSTQYTLLDHRLEIQTQLGVIQVDLDKGTVSESFEFIADENYLTID
jgi:hypothetical protein